MTYASEEAAGKGPVELYRFVLNTASPEVFTYSSDVLPSTFNAGAGDETYVPAVGLKRDRITSAQESTKAQTSVTVSKDVPVVALFVNGAAPALVTCTIYRFHRGDDISGGLTSPNIATSCLYQVAGCSRRGANATLLLMQPWRVIQDSVPRYHIQVICNHDFTGPGCGVVAATYTQSGTVSSIDVSGLVIGLTLGSTALPLGSYVDGTLTFGSFTAAVTGHTASAGTATTITLIAPIPGLTVGATISLLRGCDHQYSTCTNTFSNGPRHFGFPDLPNDDPWSREGGIPLLGTDG